MKVLLKNIAIIAAGQGAPQGDENYCDNGVPFVKAGNLAELVEGKPITEIQKVSGEVAKKYRLRLYKKGSVLFAKSGMSCLKGYIYVLPQDAYVVSHLACVIPNQDMSEYLKYYFEYNRPNKLIKDEAYPSISLTDIGELKIDIKTQGERENIVRNLVCIAYLIELQKKQLQMFDILIKSRFIEMFGDPVIDNLQWGQKSLGESLKSIRYGTSIPPKFSEDGYAFIRATNIKNGHIVLNDMKYIDQYEADKIKKCRLQGGELLIVRSGVNSGDTCVVTQEYIGQYAGYDMILEFKDEVNPIFVNEMINTQYMDKVVKPLTRRAAQPHLNSKQVQSIPLIQVPKVKQDEFVVFVHQVEKLKSEEQKRLEKTQTLFDSLMQKYFG